MVNEHLEKVISLLNDTLAIEYKGRTLKDWLVLILQFSFILWILILGWIGYNFYNNYKILRQQEVRKLSILSTKNREIKIIRKKIAEIREAYNILRNYFKPEQVTLLRNSLQKEWWNEIKKIHDWNYFASEHYIIPPEVRLSVQENIPTYGFVFQNIKLPDKTMQIFYSFYNTLINSDIKIFGSVDLDRLNNNYVLYFNPGKGKSLVLRTYKYYGYVKDIFKTNIPLLGGNFDANQIKMQGYSKPFLVGWILGFTQGGL